MPTPLSSMVITASAPASRAAMVIRHSSVESSSPCLTAFSTSGCRHRNGSATGSTSGATCKVTFSRSPNRAPASARYCSMERNSSASVVNSPCLRKE